MNNINAVGNYNGKSFLGSSSAKPIVGKVLRSIYRGNTTQGKLSITSGFAYQGLPVKALNTNLSSTAAGAGLSPNVLSLTVATADADVSGFLVENPTDVLEHGKTAPSAQDGQIVSVALLGSGVELYLPVNANVANVNVNSKLAWNFTNGNLEVSATGTIDLLGPVVDGIKFATNAAGDDVVFEDCKVAKVRV